MADVRRFPGSRRHPWFAGRTLARTLLAAGGEYLWLPQLGGRRRVQPGSSNGRWSNAALQGHADRLDSAEFADGRARLLELAARRRTALTCAEAPWWRRHRRLIADLPGVRGIGVRQILDAGHATAHALTATARVVDGRLRHPPAQDDLSG